ncbi:DNA methyltransferase [Corynebacterium flavescens]|uniref:DNA methyltransferase n=1 Tax=Corynebacterium flavescens TaxID=28028 RepID=UPI003FD3715E
MSTTPQAQLGRGDIRHRLDKFSNAWRTRIDEWKATGAKHTEKSYAQQFWSDLLRSFGIIPERIDLFEKDAVRATTGNTGYIDLFWSGVVIGEAKSLGKDLATAEAQTLDYLAGGSICQHEWPRYSIVSDFENLRVTKLGDDGWTVDFEIDVITAHVDQLIFLAGQETVTKTEEQEASIFASKLMANLYTAMVGDEADEAIGEDAPRNPGDEDWKVQKTSVFLTRVLFLLYGDDAGLWEEDLFYRFVLYDTAPDNLGGQLAQLFQVLNTPENQRRNVPGSMAAFPYVNGGLFGETWPTEFFTEEMRDALLSACRFHWTRISPAVFGSMFQLVKSKEARRADGEHYTSETNILKVIEPLFLDELHDKARRLLNNKSTKATDLRKFRDSMAEMIFLDPACGCGNFLVVAYRELRQIETDIIVALRAKEGQQTASMDVSLDQRLSIGQFYGFEINWWPAKIAETAMFLVDHQANRTLAAAVGDAPDRLPITITAHIRHGNALRIGWETEIPRTSKATYVFGNPPFRGDARDKSQQADLERAWGTKTDKISRLDFVTGWHAKALDYFENRPGSFAFVTTNSITQGDQVPRLFGPIFKSGWRIRFAHQTFIWDSEAPGKAAVHCVIVGFDRYRDPIPRLWSYARGKGEPIAESVEQGINAYLVDGPNVLVEKANNPLSPEIERAAYGSKPTDGGNLIVEVEQHEEVAKDPVAAKYLRPFKMGRELVRGLDRWCLWLVDAPAQDIERSPVLRERVSAVRDFRVKSKALSTREYARFPHLFRQIGQPETKFVAVPKVVSSARLYYTVEYMTPDVIVGDKIFAVPDPDGLQFALLSSSMFITWQKLVGGRLKSDVSFGSTLTWHTFPVPELDEKTREKVIAAGKKILAARALHPESSLAEHYSPLAMDPALVRAHDALDREVDKALGAPRKLTTERQRQELLFANYVKLTSREQV